MDISRVRITAAFNLAQTFMNAEGYKCNDHRSAQDLVRHLKEFLSTKTLTKELRERIVLALEKVLLDFARLSLDSDFTGQIYFEEDTLMRIKSFYHVLKNDKPASLVDYDSRYFERVYFFYQQQTLFARFLIDKLFEAE